MFSDRLLTFLTAILLITGIGTIGYVFWGDKIVKLSNDFNFSTGDMSCVKQKLDVSQEDEFMMGLIEQNTKLVVLKDYYDCNKIQRGDIVYTRFSASIQPIVKVVRAVGGDKFEVIPDGGSKRRYHIKVNGEYVTDRMGKFTIESLVVPPLQTYQDARNGVLKDDEVMILSNVSPGKSDSASLGLIKDRFVEGKVIIQ